MSREQANEQGQFGSLLDEAEFLASPQALPPQWAILGDWPTSLPTSTLLTGTPPIAMQGTSKHLGSPGSCEAQSFGYGLGTYTADRANGEDPANSLHQVSAAWLYAWALKEQGRSCPKGSLAIPYLRQLIDNGCPSAFRVPYEANCVYLSSIQPNSGNYGPHQFFLGSYATFKIGEDTIPLMKAFLAAGQAIAFSGRVLVGYDNPILTPSNCGCSKGVITEAGTIPRSGHGQLLIGYNDDCKTATTTGAFLIQNSFGTDWPPAAPGGTVWMSYESFLASQLLAAVAFPKTPQGSSKNSIPLDANPRSAPAASLQVVAHWAPGGKNVYLILPLIFNSPVTINSVSIQLIGFTGTGRLVTGNYNCPIAGGSLYFCRTDGYQFENGTYALTIEATLGTTTITYSCTFDLAQSAPTTPIQEPIAEATEILDTLGQKATIGGH